MQHEGILFTVLPISVLIEKGTKKWRKEVLLKENRLLAVITFPEDLFYPVSQNTLGLFIKKGIPHDYDKNNVYFARFIHDGFIKKKGIRKESKKVRNMLEEIREELKEFILGKDIQIDSIPIFKKVCLLDKNDKTVELAPEGYIDDKTPTLADIQKGLEEMIREAVAFKIKYKEKLEEIK
jgi:type I restriction-modification system DNA methylase subunit